MADSKSGTSSGSRRLGGAALVMSLFTTLIAGGAIGGGVTYLTSRDQIEASREAATRSFATSNLADKYVTFLNHEGELGDLIHSYDAALAAECKDVAAGGGTGSAFGPSCRPTEATIESTIVLDQCPNEAAGQLIEGSIEGPQTDRATSSYDTALKTLDESMRAIEIGGAGIADAASKIDAVYHRVAELMHERDSLRAYAVSLPNACVQLLRDQLLIEFRATLGT